LALRQLMRLRELNADLFEGDRRLGPLKHAAPAT
jgi:hypothetical protein